MPLRLSRSLATTWLAVPEAVLDAAGVRVQLARLSARRVRQLWAEAEDRISLEDHRAGQDGRRRDVTARALVASSWAIVIEALHGWEGVEDAAGAAIPCDPEHIALVIDDLGQRGMALVDWIIAQVQDVATWQERRDGEEDAEAARFRAARDGAQPPIPGLAPGLLGVRGETPESGGPAV